MENIINFAAGDDLNRVLTGFRISVKINCY